jgi:hypothetical protein
MDGRGLLEYLAKVEDDMRRAQSDGVSCSLAIMCTNLIIPQQIENNKELAALIQLVVHVTSDLCCSLQPFDNLAFIETHVSMPTFLK